MKVILHLYLMSTLWDVLWNALWRVFTEFHLTICRLFKFELCTIELFTNWMLVDILIFYRWLSLILFIKNVHIVLYIRESLVLISSVIISKLFIYYIQRHVIFLFVIAMHSTSLSTSYFSLLINRISRIGFMLATYLNWN